MTQPSRPATSRPWFHLPPISGSLRENLVIIACLALFLLYGSFRQRYIWGADSFGYFELGKLFSEGRVHYETRLPGAGDAALIPYGFTGNYGPKIAPNYPPGFPLLLAVGHWLRAPLWVTPFVGVVSCLVLHGLLRERVRAGLALPLTLAWAFMPLTVYGSTMVMSDLVAATTLLGGLLAYQKKRPALAAWIFGLSIAVRPTDVLFFLPFSVLLWSDRQWWRLALHLVPPALVYATYNQLLYGAPWRTGYGSISYGFVLDVFPAYSAFFVTTSVAVLSPVILALALWGLVPWNRGKLFLVLWPLVFLLLYSFWRDGGTGRWWWTRFLLPGYGAFFLLAADGCANAEAWIGRRFAASGRWIARTALVLALLALPFYYVAYGRAQRDLWVRDTGAVNREVVRRVVAAVPPGSLVGSVELTSTFTLYSDLIPYIPLNSSAPDLIARALAEGRHVYLLPEPWNSTDRVVLELQARFQPRRIAHYDFIWGGLPVYELTAR